MAFLVLPPLSGIAAEGESPAQVGGRELMAQAAAGDAWAQLNLGAAYDHGLGRFPLDPVRAVSWYRRAADAGLPEAQFNLAHCLATGNGVARDDVASLRWMLRAAEQGLASAQYLGGVMLLEGMGGPPDRELAESWLARAADNGNTDATAVLGRLRAEPAKQVGVMPSGQQAQ